MALRIFDNQTCLWCPTSTHLYSLCLNKHSVGGEGPYYFFKHCEISRSPVDSSNLLHPSNFICRPALLWQEAVRWPVPCVQTLTPDEVTPNTRCKLYLVNTTLSSSALQLLQFFRVQSGCRSCWLSCMTLQTSWTSGCSCSTPCSVWYHL